MSAGRGILHSEKNDSWTLTGHETHSEPVHFVQMWVVPDESGIDPGYQQLGSTTNCSPGTGHHRLGMPEHRDATAINIRNRYAALHGARLRPGDSVELPDAPYLHLFVPRGSVTLEDAGNLAEGDAVRFTAAGGRRLTATADAEILVWEMHAGLAG